MVQAPRPFNDNDRCYRQIPQMFIIDNGVEAAYISAGAFDNTKGTLEMSVDWALLSTPEESMARKPERAIGVFGKPVCDATGQECAYTPKEDNPSHCDIIGKKSEGKRKQFARATRIVIAPPGFNVPDHLWLHDDDGQDGQGQA